MSKPSVNMEVTVNGLKGTKNNIGGPVSFEWGEESKERGADADVIEYTWTQVDSKTRRGDLVISSQLPIDIAIKTQVTLGAALPNSWEITGGAGPEYIRGLALTGSHKLSYAYECDPSTNKYDIKT
jgi:hypothetical protein